ncbi:MAG: sugar-binding protein [Candidatus Thorarchaeota archaeon]
MNFLKTFFISLIVLIQLSVYASTGEELVDEKTPYSVPKIISEVKIDGYLDEEAWNQAVKIDANIEVSPGENILAPVKTEVYMAYDNSNIYVAFKAFDPDPSQIRANLCDRDNIWDDDWVLILFDTFNNERRSYDFGCNPLGIQVDIIESTSGGSGSWDAIWESDGRITDEGYVVEMAIPFSSLKFPRKEGEQIWGFDAIRSYPRKVRHHIGVFPRDRNNNCYFCQLEKLAGFSDVVPGRDIEFTPTFTSLVAQVRENETSGPFDEKYSNEIGLTSSWGLTNNLRLSATLNPDFSTIESDIIQVDINNRFELWYPEKRPFFLEGEDFFETEIDAVHTRTLADPNFGIKLIGKEGRNTIGFFSAQDAVTNFVIPSLEGSNSDISNTKSHGTVFRYIRDLGESSNIGLLLTDREGKNYYNRVLGLDGIFLIGKRDRIEWQVLGSKTLYPDWLYSSYDQSSDEFGGKGIHVDYSHNTKKYNFYGAYQELSPDLRTDLGFVNQTGYRYAEVGGNYIWRAGPEHWFTWINIYIGADLGKDYDNYTARKELKANFNYEGPLQSYFGVYGQISKDRYEETQFSTSYLNYWVGGTPTKWFSFNLWSVFGDRIDYDNIRPGKGLQLGVSANLKVGSRLSFNLDHYYERLNVNDGRLYTANREYVKAMYHFNERIFIRTIFQYAIYKRDPSLYLDEEVESEQQELLTQILLSYKINPHTAFYIGYSDNYYGDYDINIIQTDRTFFAKIGYAWMI